MQTVWPEQERSSVLEVVRKAYELIDPKKFEKRFTRLARQFEVSIKLDTYRETNPVELGFFLCVKHPTLLDGILPGNFTWAFEFSYLVLSLHSRLDASRWREVIIEIGQGLSETKAGHYNSLNAASFQFRIYELMEKSKPRIETDVACRVCFGSEVKIKADAAFVRNSKIYGVECKSLRQGWHQSGLPYAVKERFTRLKVMEKFVAIGSGYLLLVLPKLSGLSPEHIEAQVEKSLELVLSGRAEEQTFFLRIEYDPMAKLSDDEWWNLLRKRAPANHSHLVAGAKSSSARTQMDSPLVRICYYYKNDMDAFKDRVLDHARYAMKQVGQKNPAIIAINLDFLTSWRAKDDFGFRNFLGARIRTTELIRQWLLADLETMNHYALLIWSDLSSNSIHAAISTKILSEFLLFRNENSSLRDTSPLPFDPTLLAKIRPEHAP